MSAVTKQAGESTTAFTVRAIRYETWEDGFEAGHACTGAAQHGYCKTKRPNPFRDEAVA